MEYSTDTGLFGGTALNFVGSDGSSLECGNFDAGSSLTIGTLQTEPIPVLFEFLLDNGSNFGTVAALFLDYDGQPATQTCIRDNDC